MAATTDTGGRIRRLAERPISVLIASLLLPGRQRHFEGARLPLLIAATAACLLGACAVFAQTLYLSVKYFHPLFYWDQWDVVRAYHRWIDGGDGLSLLFAQHNEHRIAFPRLIFLADFALGRGLNIINLTCVFIVQFLHLALFAVIARRCNAALLATLSTSIVAILLFSFAQANNFTWGFQVQFVGVYAAATLALWLLALAIERQKAGVSFLGHALGAGAMGIVATYTMSNGVLVVLTMALLAAALRARPALIAGYVALAVVLLVAYFHGYRPVAEHSPPGFVLQHPFAFIAYVLIYLGGVAGSLGPVAAGVMGAVGAAMTTAAVLRLAILQKDQDSARATLTGVMVFVAATAAATAFGRAFFGLDQALSSRYFTPAAVFWSAQVIYLASFLRPSRASFAAIATFAAVAVAVLVGAVKAHLAERGEARQHYEELALASDALLSGVAASDALRLAYPDPGAPKSEAPFLRDRNLSIFSWPEAHMRGAPLPSVYPTIDNSACRGAFDSAETVAESDGVSASGWAWDRRSKALVRRVLFVDSHDAIVGFATGGARRRDVRAAVPEVRSRYVGWRGFANVPADEPLRAYAVVGDGHTVCLVGARPAPPVETVGAPPREADVAVAGAPIEGKVALSGGWTPNGYHVSAGTPPFDGPVFGSWSGADANEGEATVGPFTAPQGAFALPLVTGPSTHGQSIVVKDAETGEVYIRFRPAVRIQWRSLVLTLPPEKAARPLLLVAMDRGSEWGQWMAIGQPRAVVR